ncbi:Fic family protein [Chryseobacterium sp. JJR-5R]|uniref:Fic family protein n=1 Tax=Chryseobacterium sp. JJR-5R TaxID=3093923 RepID=UPI002A752956|nr:Fic family protein [Chryseobacterium sp. JJR-5R]WPO82774.1 Fic family protein [Chryseobacterium sp. JJR-5R]
MFNKNKPFNELPDLPPKNNLETPAIFKSVIKANKLLAELKGFCQTLPHPELLLNTIVLQESKESNAIENIVTTQDELYKATLMGNDIKNQSSKEVLQYREAMYWGKEQLKKNNLITTNLLIGVMQRLRNSSEGIRKNTGTKLANPANNIIIYTPPEGEQIIRDKLSKLELFINDESMSELDPLIKMALIHYQFEAIHPFSDGNGRTGRILNVLYLLQQELLGLPVLYLSRYIIENKSDYYRLLKEVTETGNWENWVSFVINGVASTSEMTLVKIKDILELKSKAYYSIRNEFKKGFSKELVDLLFSYPYIKISILEQYNIAKRQTASEYLKKIAELGWLHPIKIGRDIYYSNYKLIDVLSR